MGSLLKSPRAWAVAVAFVLAFTVVWHLTAYPRGMLMAHLDHARGHYEVKLTGDPLPWDEGYARLLKERYGVELRRVASCVVPEELGWYVEGYNSVSERRLVEKFGPEIFEECADAAQSQWEAEHPDQGR